MRFQRAMACTVNMRLRRQPTLKTQFRSPQERFHTIHSGTHDTVAQRGAQKKRKEKKRE